MFPPQQPPRYTGPIIGSIVLHVAVFAALLLNVDWGDSDEDIVLANVIDAEVVEPGVLEDVKKEEQRRKQEQERQKRQAEQRQREQQSAREAAERKAAEQKAAEQEAQRREALRIAEEKKRQAEEQARREDAQRREAEQERLRQEMRAEEQRLREQAQRAEWEKLQNAEEQARAQARSRELATKMQIYKQAIKQRVDRNWIRPVSAEDWYTCEVIVDQIPGGEIVNVQFDSCDGDSVFQRSVRNAVYKSSPLPDPPDSALFERRLHFTFKVPDQGSE